ncbi:response regulator [Bacteroidota bacterium]
MKAKTPGTPDKTLILVVEDSPAQLIQLQHMLEDKNFRVITSTNGKEALDILEKEIPALVISDIIMPLINGYELCRKIKENKHTSDIPVILVTALSNPEDVLEGLASGADNYLTKPFSQDNIISHIEQILRNCHLNKQEKRPIEIEINFFGQRRLIKADQQQMLMLLLSTYEAAVVRNNELTQIQKELQALNDSLEEVVEERTNELRTHKKKYLDFFNNAPAMLLSFDPASGIILECNDTLLHKTGFLRKEVEGKILCERFFPEQMTGVEEQLRQFSSKGKFKEMGLSLVTKIGTQIPIVMRVSAMRNDTDEIIQGRAVFQDITGIRRAEEDLRQSEERYRAVADSAVDAIITLDSSGLIVGWNRAAEKLFGYSEAEMGGEPVTLIMPESSQKQHHDGINRIQQGEDERIIGKTVELKGKRKGGEEFPIELSLASWTTDDGKFFTGIIRDITLRKNTEEELLKAKVRAEESDKLKSAFLANMSHEIRTPMNGIIGFTQLMEDPDITPEERTSFIDIIKTSSNRLLQVITDIVDISKVESGQTDVDVKEFNIVKLTNEILALYRPKADAKKLSLEIVSRLNTSETNISSDPDKLHQALCHIVDNALKFTSSGGVVLDIDLKNQILVVKIIDTGIGISPDLHERIFDRFRQEETDVARKYGGTGLGLSLAKSYIEMLGGMIWLTSTPGKGTTFVVEVPVTLEDEPLKEKAQTKEPEYKAQPFENISILIAEDEPDNATYLQMILERLGIELYFAETGEEAVNVCKRHPELSLILMDVKMPVMDGLEATRVIRKFRPDLPIVATTAFAMGSDKERCLAAGCSDYLTKPLRKEILLKTIKKYVS